MPALAASTEVKRVKTCEHACDKSLPAGILCYRRGRKQLQQTPSLLGSFRAAPTGRRNQLGFELGATKAQQATLRSQWVPVTTFFLFLRLAPVEQQLASQLVFVALAGHIYKAGAIRGGPRPQALVVTLAVAGHVPLLQT
jgi:hypothetical protein